MSRSKEVEEAIKKCEYIQENSFIWYLGSDNTEAIGTVLNYISKLEFKYQARKDKYKTKIEKLEEENKQLKKVRNWYFENTVAKAVTPEILRQDYVPKQVIRDKIKDINFSGGSDGKDEKENFARELIIEVLEELLGE